jgi:hypothetical protein
VGTELLRPRKKVAKREGGESFHMGFWVVIGGVAELGVIQEGSDVIV